MTVRNTSIRVFLSTDSGAPELSGLAGSGIPVFDAFLVSGYGSVTATSLVVSSGIATLTVDAGHGFTDPGATWGIDAGVVVRVSGVTGAASDLNADWRATVTSATVLTWECGTSIPDGSASGTIAVKRAPLDWVKAFTATDKAAYRSQDPQATGCLVRMDDTGTKAIRFRGYVAMTDIDTGTDPFPTDAQANGGSYLQKSSLTTSTPRAWMAVGDSRAWYFSSVYNGTGSAAHFFGDVAESAVAGDPWACALHGSVSSGVSGNMGRMDGSSRQAWLARSISGAVGAVAAALRGFYAYSSHNIQNAYPSPLNGGVTCAMPVLSEEYQGELRGPMPGMVELLNYCYADLVEGKMLDPLGFDDPVICLGNTVDSLSPFVGLSLGAWR